LYPFGSAPTFFFLHLNSAPTLIIRLVNSIIGGFRRRLLLTLISTNRSSAAARSAGWMKGTLSHKLPRNRIFSNLPAGDNDR